MKNFKNYVLISLVLIIIILVGIIVNLVLHGNDILNKKQIIKEMTQSENEANLQTQIDTLNTSHNEYAKNVESFKNTIIEAITNEGIATSITDSQETIVANIGKIFKTRTTIAEETAATKEYIAEGKQAYVNGELITGTLKPLTNKYIGSFAAPQSGDGTKLLYTNINISNYLDNYQDLTADNFICQPTGIKINTSVSFSLTANFSKSYNSQTGVLTVTCGRVYNSIPLVALGWNVYYITL